MNWEPTTKPWIVCAAIRFNDHIVCGPRHWDTTMRKMVDLLKDHEFWGKAEQGFIDQFGRFYNREEAMQVARQNNQIIVSDSQMLSLTALHSEDLY